MAAEHAAADTAAAREEAASARGARDASATACARLEEDLARARERAAGAEARCEGLLKEAEGARSRHGEALESLAQA